MNEPLAKVLQPPSVLLMGPPGSGKTFSLVTLLESGIEVFVIVTEPNGIESLLDVVKEKGLDVTKLHWCYITPVAGGWDAMADMAKWVNALSYKDLSEKKDGISKDKMKSLEKMISCFMNFVDDRTGIAYGDVASWGPERALVLDSLSGLNIIAMQHTVGFKPSPHQGEWGIAMSMEEQMLLKLTADCKCFFILTAHVDKEPDELTGGTKIMASALGRKLAPKIPRFFSEVVLSKRAVAANNVGTFTWATASNDADLKNRALPIGSALLPSFKPIVEAYRRRVEMSKHQ